MLEGLWPTVSPLPAGFTPIQLLRWPGNQFYCYALQIALIVGALPAVVQPL